MQNKHTMSSKECKFTFIVDCDHCLPEMLRHLLDACVDGPLKMRCNRILIFRGRNKFSLIFSDTSKPYRDLMEKHFYDEIPEAFLDNANSFVAYTIGVASAHTGNMRDHLSEIVLQNLPFLNQSTENKRQHFVFVSSRKGMRDAIPDDSHRVSKPDHLQELSELEIVGRGGTGVESLVSMLPDTSRLSALFQMGQSK